jgi:hypothetical protein
VIVLNDHQVATARTALDHMADVLTHYDDTASVTAMQPLRDKLAAGDNVYDTLEANVIRAAAVHRLDELFDDAADDVTVMRAAECQALANLIAYSA